MRILWDRQRPIEIASPLVFSFLFVLAYFLYRLPPRPGRLDRDRNTKFRSTDGYRTRTYGGDGLRNRTAAATLSTACTRNVAIAPERCERRLDSHERRGMSVRSP